MAGGEDKLGPLVADFFLGLVKTGAPELPVGLGLALEARLLALESALAPQHVVPPALADRHQPCRRVARGAIHRPLLERSHEGILGQVLMRRLVTKGGRYAFEWPAAACSSGGNSDTSMTWRTSIMPPGCPAGHRLAHSIASSLDLTSISQ
jgi:hypothetical protein